jgi:uncharacterized protein YutE (UPF0331/DUF86 family)
MAGVKLAGLHLPDIKAGDAERSFEALKEERVISAALCKRLRRTQKARNLIEHDYEKVNAGQLHDVAEEVRELGREFVRPFRAWIEPLL